MRKIGNLIPDCQVLVLNEVKKNGDFVHFFSKFCKDICVLNDTKKGPLQMKRSMIKYGEPYLICMHI